jgi:hypothetical protein
MPAKKQKMEISRTKNSIRSGILKVNNFSSGKEVLEKVPWESMSDAVGRALKSLLHGRNTLRDAYISHLKKTQKAQKKAPMTFALDGRLVGDIGELIAAEMFALDLLGTKSKNVDAETTCLPNRKVQIKATFKSDGLSIKHGNDYLIGLQFNDTGQFRVIYNGPAEPVMSYLTAPASNGKTGRTKAGSRLEGITLEAWSILNLSVATKDRISRAG